ncbi:hypothetical protein B0F90DRAFT_1673841 [Multifurca ochricompacta]|uniref:Uncharacterized protein n=1 Tax=Multifurca ochricompacta TaxID=376703 RepID=A0AAD4MC72_9AGAM|nr:hypothetical protein B0F90DRAFT_1673841 [Multifurca ochricompacta]
MSDELPCQGRALDIIDGQHNLLTIEMKSSSRGVRFDDECILIPDPQRRSRMPKLLVKPSSFIFKRRHSQDSSSPSSPHDHDVFVSPPAFPRPALSRKFSLNDEKPLAPPIHRHSSLPPTTRLSRVRPSSLSPSPRSELVTIPLRPCCPDCFSATERAALQGENWTEKFSRAARRRRSASVDNHPCPPHIIAGSGTTIQWSPATESAHTIFRPLIASEEADCEGGLVTSMNSISDEQEVSEVEMALDHLSIQGRADGTLRPLLTRHNPWLSPIPSNNTSADDLSPACPVIDNVDNPPRYCPAKSALVSPPSSPLPQTPSSTYSTPVFSPKIESPPSPKQSESPRIASSFRVPKGGTLMRAGTEILKGVTALGGGPF